MSGEVRSFFHRARVEVFSIVPDRKFQRVELKQLADDLGCVLFPFGLLTFWYFGILAFWHFDILAFWHFGILAFWRPAARFVALAAQMPAAPPYPRNGSGCA